VLAKNDGIRIAKVDATAHKERAEELGVHGYPSVKAFVNGKFHEDYKQVCVDACFDAAFASGGLHVCERKVGGMRMQPA
jgi:hypothetical protein